MIFLFPSPTFSCLMQIKSKFRRNMKVVSFFHLLGKTYCLFIILPFHFTLFFPSLPFLFPSLFHHPPISFLYAIYFISLISITSQSPPPLIKLRLLSSLPISPSHSLLSTVYPAACPFPFIIPRQTQQVTH